VLIGLRTVTWLWLPHTEDHQFHPKHLAFHHSSRRCYSSEPGSLSTLEPQHRRVGESWPTAWIGPSHLGRLAFQRSSSWKTDFIKASCLPHHRFNRFPSSNHCVESWQFFAVSHRVSAAAARRQDRNRHHRDERSHLGCCVVPPLTGTGFESHLDSGRAQPSAIRDSASAEVVASQASWAASPTGWTCGRSDRASIFRSAAPMSGLSSRPMRVEIMPVDAAMGRCPHLRDRCTRY